MSGTHHERVSHRTAAGSLLLLFRLFPPLLNAPPPFHPSPSLQVSLYTQPLQPQPCLSCCLALRNLALHAASAVTEGMQVAQRRLTLRVLGVLQADSILSQAFVKKYVRYARRTARPQLAENATEKICELYMNMRSK